VSGLAGELHCWTQDLHALSKTQVQPVIKRANLPPITPPQEINVQKLLRGSKVDTLELLQYLHKYLKREWPHARQLAACMAAACRSACPPSQ
jgi:hypothetical protein